MSDSSTVEDRPKSKRVGALRGLVPFLWPYRGMAGAFLAGAVLAAGAFLAEAFLAGAFLAAACFVALRGDCLGTGLLADGLFTGAAAPLLFAFAMRASCNIRLREETGAVRYVSTAS